MKYLTLLILALFACLNAEASSEKDAIQKNEILWDEWGVPHIYATNDVNLYKMTGWAQMRNHANELLRQYGAARAKSAEYWGVNLEEDIKLHQAGVMQAAEKIHDKLPESELKLLQAFTDGINAYAAQYPDQIDTKYEKVLPVEPVDVVYHYMRIGYDLFVLSFTVYSDDNVLKWPPGSNAWAVNGSKTASGNPMLLINPHLAWSGETMLFELHHITNEKNLYGATILGFLDVALGFNEHLGWTHTVNPIDNGDVYEIEVKDNQYLIDGTYKDFEVDSVTLVLKNDSLRTEQTVAVKRSDYGMIIRESDNKALAVRWANMNGEFDWLGQSRALGKAKNLKEFQAALSQNGLPKFNVIYADKEDNIMYRFTGQVPKKTGDWEKWLTIVPATSSEEIWDDYYAIAELPGYLNPESGWIQNANDPPYTSTFPPVLNPEDYPSHIAPNYMNFRAQRSAKLLQQAANLTLDDFIALKHDTKSELALRLRDDLVVMKRKAKDSLTLAALEVLTSWDGSFDASSIGPIVFLNLGSQLRLKPSEPFLKPPSAQFKSSWSNKDPLNTPYNLKKKNRILKVVKFISQRMLDMHGSLEVPLGNVLRLKAGKYEYPGHGASDQWGIFRTVSYAPGGDGKWYSVHGDSFVGAVEFGDTIKAKVLLSHGNSSQPDNPHYGDQLKLFSEKKLRDVWLTRAEQEAHLEMVERLEDMN